MVNILSLTELISVSNLCQIHTKSFWNTIKNIFQRIGTHVQNLNHIKGKPLDYLQFH